MHRLRPVRQILPAQGDRAEKQKAGLPHKPLHPLLLLSGAVPEGSDLGENEIFVEDFELKRFFSLRMTEHGNAHPALSF